MDKAIKVLAWYIAIIIVISTLAIASSIGPSSGITPRIGVFVIILNTPIVVLAILVLRRMRHQN